MKTINTAPNSPFKGYYPNVNPFGISPRYDSPNGLGSLYKKVCENDDITSTIKPIDREKANLEAEKDEVLMTFKSTGAALHRIQGKLHSKGGTPLNVPDGSFIFSKDKSMALSKEEMEEFKLGKFMKGGGVNNSPAKVLERNVDLKHNNKMVNNLENSKNFAEKNTARLMLEKYQRTLSTVAALQEIRKHDSEIPQFAQLIPQNPQIEKQEERQEQYSKGGWYNKPLPKAMGGGDSKLIKDPNEGVLYRTVNGIRVPIDPTKPSINELPINMALGQERNFTPDQQDQIIDNSTPSYKGGLDSELNINDDMSWIKPYDWTPKYLSMIGNALQSPRSLYPSLALQTPYQIRGQQMDAQPGIDSINANAIASRKASQMYASPQQQNNQLINAQANKMTSDYANKISQFNQQNATNVHNTNAQVSNQVLNTNNQLRGQFMDKVNELKQNVSDTRNSIAAANLNLFGEGINENKNYNTSVDFMKKYQPWNVQSKMGQKDIFKMAEDFNKIKNAYPAMDQQMMWNIQKLMMQQYKNISPNATLPQSLLQ